MKEILSVIVPAYNEEKTISAILDELLSHELVGEIIVINDASKDSTAEVLRKYSSNRKVKVFECKVNKGKGAAIRKGFDEASFPIVIIQDADLEYSPSDFSVLIAPIVSGKADVVYGSRFQGGQGRVLYFKHQLGNKLITFISNLLTDLNFTDIETCYKAFRREVIQNIIFESDRFGIEVEITAKIAKAKVLKIYEVPITYNGRTYAEGKKITWKDGLAALWHIIRFNLLKNPSSYFKKPWDKVSR